MRCVLLKQKWFSLQNVINLLQLLYRFCSAENKIVIESKSKAKKTNIKFTLYFTCSLWSLILAIWILWFKHSCKCNRSEWVKYRLLCLLHKVAAAHNQYIVRPSPNSPFSVVHTSSYRYCWSSGKCWRQSRHHGDPNICTTQ